MHRKVNGLKGIFLFLANFISYSVILGGIWAFFYTWLTGHGSLWSSLPAGVVIGVITMLIKFFRQGFLKDMLFSYFENKEIGNLVIKSGDLFICDPLYLKKNPVGCMEIKGFNPGSLPVKITLKQIGEIKKIIKAEIGNFDFQGVNKLLGQIPVTSNSICLVDKESFRKKFQFYGIERVGMIYGNDHQQIAEKIKNKLDLDYIVETDMSSRFLETISENLERGIRTFLNQREKDSFFIWTNNTYDKISKKMGENYQKDYTYTIEEFEENSDDNMVVLSVIKNKYHKIYGVFNENELIKITIEIE